MTVPTATDAFPHPMRPQQMPAKSSQLVDSFLRRSAALLLIALAALLVGCGGSEVQTTPTSLEKPPLAVPEGSVSSTSSSKKSGSTSSTSSSDTSSDTSTGTGTDTGGDTGTDTGGAGTDTGGADNGTGTGTGTGGADTGGAGPGN